jgi:uncharacterized membrane protein YebE (DUF533 family)
MSFVRTLATLAAGVAMAKGFDRFQKVGGMSGVHETLKSNPATAGIAEQVRKMMEQFGVPGAARNMSDMASTGGGAAMAGFGQLMAVIGGAQAAGAAQASAMIDSMTGTTAASAATEANAKLMIRAMIQAAKADGTIDDEERAKIMSALVDSTPEERAFVEAELKAPVDPVALARDTADEAKGQVYAAAASTVKLDSGAEEQFLTTLATSLGIDADERARIDAAIGFGGAKR